MAGLARVSAWTMSVVVATAAAGCASGQRDDGEPAMFGGTGRGEDGTATADTSGPGATSTSSAEGTADGSGESEGGTADAGSGSSEPGSETGPPEGCGDGEIGLGEQCDDGNDSDLDGCTIWCTIPTCTDGMWSGLETDVDCGGPCQACELCDGCSSDADCMVGTICGSQGACTVTGEITVDYLANCGAEAENAVVASGLPDGTYLATALPSAGTVWGEPHSPPATGWFWVMQCVGFELMQMRTPVGVTYATPEEAFDNLMAGTEPFELRGGQLECYRSDSACVDNAGEVSMSYELQCP